ncbi:MAG: hypothetical protein AAGA80_23125 [Cyanobacteria bacterium P01_F01_bin.143]
MNQIFSTVGSVTFKPNQIVCLEFKDERLYSEVIQIIEQRQTCWVRPILISRSEIFVCDLRSSSDLILPLGLFRPCFDTEMIPLLTQLNQFSSISHDKSTAFNLNAFVQQVWRNNQDKF